MKKFLIAAAVLLTGVIYFATQKDVLWALITGAAMLACLLLAGRQELARRAKEKALQADQARRAEEYAQEQERQRVEQERQRQERAARYAQFEQQREARIQQAIAYTPDAARYRVASPELVGEGRTLGVTEFFPIARRRYVSIDFETTGLSAEDDAIVEIGAVLVVDGRPAAEYTQLIDPGFPMPADAARVNGITDDMLRGMPRIFDALPSLLAFIGDDVLAAHNARFDRGFLEAACRACRFRAPERWFDSMALARYWPESANKKLGTLADAAGIRNDDAHRALGDARTVAALISASAARRSR